MKWLIEPVILDSPVAALIAEDLRQLAAIDGELHERELALIEAFEGGIAEPAAAGGASLDSPALRRTYVRSLVMLALADGDLRREEHELILELADRRGVERAEVDRIIEHLGLQFYGDLEAARQFRDSLRQAAEDAGLRPEQTREMWN